MQIALDNVFYQMTKGPAVDDCFKKLISSKFLNIFLNRTDIRKLPNINKTLFFQAIIEKIQFWAFVV